MAKLYNAKTNKLATVVSTQDDTMTLDFGGGEIREFKKAVVNRWYKEVADDFVAPAAPETANNNGSTTAQMTDEEKEAKAAADAAAKEAAKKAKEDAKVAAQKAKEDEKAKKAAEAEAAKAAKKAEADAKKAVEDAKKAEAEAAKAAKKAEAEAAKAAKKAEAEAAKAKRDAEKAARADQGSAKDRNKSFFARFLQAVNARIPDYTKAGARDRNYMSFPAGASGFKYKVVYNEGKLSVSLYIFGPQIVTSALFNEIEKYKADIEATFSDTTLDWSAPEDLKVRRIRVTMEGSDEELVAKGVDMLLRFESVFNSYIDKITA